MVDTEYEYLVDGKWHPVVLGWFPTKNLPGLLNFFERPWTRHFGDTILVPITIRTGHYFVLLLNGGYKWCCLTYVCPSLCHQRGRFIVSIQRAIHLLDVMTRCRKYFCFECFVRRKRVVKLLTLTSQLYHWLTRHDPIGLYFYFNVYLSYVAHVSYIIKRIWYGMV